MKNPNTTPRDTGEAPVVYPDVHPNVVAALAAVARRQQADRRPPNQTTKDSVGLPLPGQLSKHNSYDRLRSQPASINQLVDQALTANYCRSPEEAEQITQAVEAVEQQTGLSVLDWLPRYRRRPASCPESMVRLIRSGVLGMLHMEAAEGEFLQRGGDYDSDQAADLGRLGDHLADSLTLTMGLDCRPGDGTPRGTILQGFRQEIIQRDSRSVELQRVITQEGVEAIHDFIESVQSIGGAKPAERLHQTLGIVNFDRWSPDTLRGALQALDAPAGQAIERSVLVCGRSGDHNGAMGGFRQLKGLNHVLPVEVEHPDELLAVSQRLAAKGIRLSRLTIAGHGNEKGVRLSSSDQLPIDQQALRHHPLGQLIRLIQPDQQGHRTVNIVSCSAGHRFAGKPHSFAGALAEAYADGGVQVHASPGVMRLAQDDTMEGGTVHFKSRRRLPELPGLPGFLRPYGKEGQAVRRWLEEQIEKVPRSNRVVTMTGTTKTVRHKQSIKL